jgi:hypothetical protein
MAPKITAPDEDGPRYVRTEADRCEPNNLLGVPGCP